MLLNTELHVMVAVVRDVSVVHGHMYYYLK